ncbi:MAG: phosphate ABC transporter ATP-binding protein [Omnitrophica WOR_2 bacterium RIFCSPHIGHO2_01_FULL_48_9]|nr:MAG: phosphate ABC transporter ATP-binding protein [Omnitrophica WOR_2 bacterium RIFCSPHIGHO2_02_FULL_48_11]OGX31070.1 MAG: phosphate ABC transporter ATP-binding protein [Omnitrophica WOR_2 bacterium RIFCSPHIGHO2_01_FULL_48_9]
MVKKKPKIKMENFSVWFDQIHALKAVSIDVFEHEILGAIGPSNSGKTTFLRSLNRFNDLTTDFRCQGKVVLDGWDIYKDIPIGNLRKRVGMVFALPVALPLSIFENVVYGPRRHGVSDKNRLAEIVEQTLKESYLWDEVKDRLHTSGMKLSGGQQQRLCLARTLAVEPDIILYDEPCSGLDPISTAKIEEAMIRFKKKYTQILVTNNTKQAARVSDRTAFFLMGDLIELDETGKIFTFPQDKRTNDYISGRFG